MPAFQGLNYAERPFPAPPLTLVVFGSAVDGPLGQSCWFQDVDQAAFAFGAVAIARFSPNTTTNTFTFPGTFQPDDPMLRQFDGTRIYQFDSSGNAFPYYFGNLQSSGTPVVLNFDPIGDDSSVGILPGGLFIEAPAYGRGSAGDLVLPLISAIQENNALSNQQTAYAIAGCRVGSSWLPEFPPEADVTFPGFTVSVIAVGQGDNGTYERYTSVKVIVGTGSIIVDPGLAGLPYIRQTYNYSSYSSWNLLLDTITTDSQNNIIPIRITNRPARNASTVTQSPSSGSTTTTTLAYLESGSTPPDLTTAAGWLSVLQAEDLPIEQASLIVLSGLTGQAMSNDSTSSLAILQTILAAQEQSEESQYPILLLPWSLTPPSSGSVYDPTDDITAMTSLATAVGEYADHLLILWGTTVQSGLPSYPNYSPRFIPIAYLTAGALLRAGNTTSSSVVSVSDTDNLLHPQLLTATQTGIPIILIENAANPPSPTIPTSIPNPTTLRALRDAYMSPFTRSLGDTYRILSPIYMGDGTPLHVILIEEGVRYIIQTALDSYIGQNDTQDAISDIENTLESLSGSIPNLVNPIGQQIASLSLSLTDSPDTLSGPLVSLLVTGQMTLYGEIGSIVFQTKVGV